MFKREYLNQVYSMHFSSKNETALQVFLETDFKLKCAFRSTELTLHPETFCEKVILFSYSKNEK